MQYIFLIRYPMEMFRQVNFSGYKLACLPCKHGKKTLVPNKK
jgi:hypothetical protein